MRLTAVKMTFSDSVHDVRRGKCYHGQYKTILDRLVIANPNVTNFLVELNRFRGPYSKRFRFFLSHEWAL
jgi:hypothetical protein